MSSKVEHSTELSDSANKNPIAKRISLPAMQTDDNSSSKCAESGKQEAICSKNKNDHENSLHSTEPHSLQSLGSSCKFFFYHKNFILFLL